MNTKLPKIIIGAILLTISSVSPDDVLAVTVASEDQVWSDQLTAWQVIQELGSNLSGTLSSFTFRVNTTSTNLSQFDYTAQNTRIYDKDNNSFVGGCVSSGDSPADPMRGLTFTTSGVPPGYEDVTIDFSCRNYNFITGHKYLILITNANLAQYGGKRIKFAAAAYGAGGHGGSDQFNGGGLRYAFDNGVCSAASYTWNSSFANYGCNILTNTKDDLYFVLTNNALPPPPPRLPVIFIPGIGGSELRASQDIIWSKDDGHGGTYSHAYSSNEKIWVNQDQAINLGDDDYFDVLRLKADGVTSEADLSLTGNLTSFGYPDIDNFFIDMGYVKGTNYFVFPYDWRKDVRSTKDSLDALIESAQTASGQPQVNLVAHSMGGLVARYYISDATKAAKVNKLIELGVPHLGAAYALKTLVHGTDITYRFKFFEFPVIPGSEVKDLFQTFPAAFQLIPSKIYFDFYDNGSKDRPYPLKDDRDIDNDSITGPLNYNQTKTLLSNLASNMTAFELGEAFHTIIDTNLTQTNNVITYEIVGTAQPTLGQIHETLWVTWPVNLFSKTDEIFINGDGTVPLYSASLKKDSSDISGATKIYYVEQKHGDLVNNNGAAMQTVKGILNDDNAAIPVIVKDEKIVLEGEQISLDDGELDLYDEQNRHCGLNDHEEMEENIPEVTCTISGNTKHAFIKKKAAKVKVKVTRKNPTNSSKTTNLKKRTYRQDRISKTTLYKDINIPSAGKIEFDLDPTLDDSPPLTLYPDELSPNNSSIPSTSEVSGSTATDQTPPSTSVQITGTKDSSGIYTDPVTITLTGTDTESGILKIEYSLDNGQTVQTYTGPFAVSAPGTTIVQIKAIDNLGNEEIPQTITIQIVVPPTPTPTSTPTPSPTSTSISPTSQTTLTSETSQTTPTSLNTPNSTSNSISSSPNILGITFKNPSHVSDQINVGGLLDQEKKVLAKQNPPKSVTEFLSGLLIVSCGIVTLAFLSLIATFRKQSPK